MIKYCHPIPLINTAVDTLSGATFTKVDLHGTYNLVCEWITTFITSTSNYKTLVMLFRLCNSPAVFQEFFSEVLC